MRLVSGPFLLKDLVAQPKSRAPQTAISWNGKKELCVRDSWVEWQQLPILYGMERNFFEFPTNGLVAKSRGLLFDLPAKWLSGIATNIRKKNGLGAIWT